MRAALYDCVGEFEKHVDVPDAFAAAQVLTLDGQPYVFVSEGVYRCANGNWVSWSATPDIEVAHVLKQQKTIQIHSTRWLSGVVAIAKSTRRESVDLPLSSSLTLRFDDERPIRLSSLWCPTVEKSHSSLARRAANDFCNKRQAGTKLFATCLAIDIEGRLICDLTRSKGQSSVSMREKLLKTGLFLPCQWRVTK